MAINLIVDFIKERWGTPKTANHKGIKTLFELVCQFNPGCDYSDKETSFPSEILDFWKTSDGAQLFKDPIYGQWGLSILSHNIIEEINQIVKEERPEDFTASDLIIGQFIGDSDLLVRFSNGKIIIATPFDRRDNWEIVANNLEEFLEQYTHLQGDKFWE